MKLLVLLVLFSTNSFAQREASIYFDGAKTLHQISLKTSVYRTEYREEEIEKTCLWRTCSDGSKACFAESYPCNQFEFVPYEVFDYNLEAFVSVAFSANEKASYNEQINLNFKDAKLNLEVAESTEYLYVLNKKNITSEKNEKTKSLNAQYEIRLVNNKSFSEAAKEGIKNLELNNKRVSFSFAPFKSELKTVARVKVIRVKRLAANKIVFKKDFSLSSIRESKNSFMVDLEKNGISLKKGRYSIKVELILDTEGLAIVNESAASVSKSQIFKK